VIAPFPSVIWNIAELYAKVFRENGYEARLMNCREGMFRLKFFLKLIRIRKNFDIINVHASGYFDDVSLIYSIIAAKLSKIRGKKQKTVFTCHSGSLNKYLKKRKFIKSVYKMSDCIITVSEFMKNELVYFDKSLKHKIIVVQNFLDETASHDDEYFNRKENVALTVSTVSHWYVIRKGLNTFIEAAKYSPDVNFVIVGKHADDSIHYLKSIAPNNVIFTGYVSADERDNWFKRSLVYCQLSSSEGLCVALLESMSFGCVPVVTNTTSNPEVVGECGFLVPYGDAMKTVEAVKTAILHPEKGKCALERFNSNFTLEARRKDLVNIIERVWNVKV
jgi:glycosyltransferase involved in cell wall biosynthesis